MRLFSRNVPSRDLICGDIHKENGQVKAFLVSVIWKLWLFYRTWGRVWRSDIQIRELKSKFKKYTLLSWLKKSWVTCLLIIWLSEGQDITSVFCLDTVPRLRFTTQLMCNVFTFISKNFVSRLLDILSLRLFEALFKSFSPQTYRKHVVRQTRLTEFMQSSRRALYYFPFVFLRFNLCISLI